MDDNFLLLNPDILEIVLSHITEMAIVLNGELTLALRHLKPGVPGGDSYYLTENLFKHVSLEALDPELLSLIKDLLFIPDEEFIKNLTEPSPERLRIKGINMFYVKYSHLDFNVVQYYNNLYNKLQQQTNDFDPVEMGKRIIFIPSVIPPSFDEIFEIFEPLTEEFRLYSKFIQSSYGLEEPFKDMASLNEFMDMHGAYSSDPETYKKEVCEFMAPMRDPNGLSLAQLESYREKYNACITVTPENCRLYTRARFIFNMFIELNEHVMKHVASNPNMSYNDSLSLIYEYIGLAARNIITNQHHLYLDDTNYPVFSELYRSGSIKARQFPESVNYTTIQKLCYCRWCYPFTYSAQLYDGNDGNAYILVNLREQHYTTYIDFLESKRCKCMYNLFIYDMEYHYGRLDALASWREKLETTKHKQVVDIEELVRRHSEFTEDWFSPLRRNTMRMIDADRIYERVRDGYL